MAADADYILDHIAKYNRSLGRWFLQITDKRGDQHTVTIVRCGNKGYRVRNSRKAGTFLNLFNGYKLIEFLVSLDSSIATLLAKPI
jgi:hypothetical protein